MIDKKKFYINGEWIDPSIPNDHKVIDPSNEEPYVTISLGGTEDTNKAVSAAKNSFNTWKNSSKEERLSLLEKITKDLYFSFRRNDQSYIY
jgi:aldehyde dehydrogenase (NAD+)